MLIKALEKKLADDLQSDPTLSQPLQVPNHLCQTITISW